ncbi:glycoside hydrolase family 9 protein [Sphingomonas sp. PL-96]|uniref:glycoside hydrolase family 9 protein n=1 Tax=Sphingomonas sp. PL-96 TaxID=2887201 RepID=UPI001E2DA9FF|nr:glycoside hydrolase family 9 protein [Sphingomonas sp. PL-96]MCC2977902.1 glycoside hydrolase family 9 protein [Sphingomonas sp. PL-96]
MKKDQGQPARIWTAGTAAAAMALLLGAAAPEPPHAEIRMSQIALERSGPKTAILVTAQETAQHWTLRDAAGALVAEGQTIPLGADAASGERLQRIDFSAARLPIGNGYRLQAGNAKSRTFAIAARPYAPLATAAMAFFYQQRSAVPILPAFVERPDLARAAGHPMERVTCFSGTDQRGVRWPGCSYSLDVTGGWYDAGDHGKYVVNGGIATWTLLDLHQRLAAWGNGDAFADGRLALPEAGNGRDDLLDEARVEVEFLLSMQVPQDAQLAVATTAGGGKAAGDFRTIAAGGLVHSKVADTRWTGLPTRPADDRMPRALYPPTTAATLNLAAVAAQAARIWRKSDPAFAARALLAARRAWAAAERYPALFASSDFAGSGGYGDEALDDERFWAAAELYATTGERPFEQAVTRARFLARPQSDLTWNSVDQAGLATLATMPAAGAARNAARAAVLRLADGFLAERTRSGYRLPYASPDYDWGSNSVLLNRALLLGVAWQVTHEARYRTAVVDVMEYLLGRNALDQSYITGFGARPMRFPHHRFWHPVDPRYPAPPAGVVSGGPNSTALADDVAATMRGRCVGQTCWTDDWRAFSMNEVAINWNAPLVWVAAFLDATRPS